MPREAGGCLRPNWWVVFSLSTLSVYINKQFNKRKRPGGLEEEFFRYKNILNLVELYSI